MRKTESILKICYFICTVFLMGSVFLFPFHTSAATGGNSAPLPYHVVNNLGPFATPLESALNNYGYSLSDDHLVVFGWYESGRFGYYASFKVLCPVNVPDDFTGYSIPGNFNYNNFDFSTNTFNLNFNNANYKQYRFWFEVNSLTTIQYTYDDQSIGSIACFPINPDNFIDPFNIGLPLNGRVPCYLNGNLYYEGNINQPVFVTDSDDNHVPGLEDLVNSGSFLSGLGPSNFDNWDNIVPDSPDNTTTSTDTDNWLKKIYNNIVDFKNKVVSGISDIIDDFENGIQKTLDSINYGIAKIVEFIQSIQDGSFISKLLTPSEESIQSLYDEFSDEIIFYNNCYEYGAALSTSLGAALAYQHETAPSLTLESFSIGGVTVPDQEISFDWFVEVKLFSDPIISVFLIGGYCWFLFTRLPSFIKGIPTQPSNNKKE